MHYFLLPMIPLTIAGALFFRSRLAAYLFPLALTLLKMLNTKVSPLYVFTGLALLGVAALTRRIGKGETISIKSSALYAVLGVLVYEGMSNFGVWMIGGCVPGVDRLYALNPSGLLACYHAALPYAGLHFLKAVSGTVVIVQLLEWLGRWNVATHWQKLISGKASSSREI